MRRTAVGVLREAHMSRTIPVHHGVRVEEEGVLNHQRRRVRHVQVVPVEVAPWPQRCVDIAWHSGWLRRHVLRRHVVRPRQNAQPDASNILVVAAREMQAT